MATYIKLDPINQLNFLRWHEPQGGPVDGDAFIINGECMLPYMPDSRPGSACKVLATYDAEIYAMPAVYYDPFTFIINTPYSAASAFQLLLMQGTTFYDVPGFAPSYITAGSDQYLSGAFNVPCVPEGQYNLVLTHQVGPVGETPIAGKSIVLVSNPIRVINYQSQQHPTVWAEFRHNVAQFGYPYSADLVIKNRFRIDALLTVGKPVEKVATYEDRNRQVRYIGQGRLEKEVDFKTDYLNAETHEAIAAMFLHSDLTINGKAMQKLEAYETELDNDTYTLYQGAAKLKDLGFTALSNPCQSV